MYKDVSKTNLNNILYYIIMSSSKSFFEICEEFFDIIHPNFYKDENIELIQDENDEETTDKSDCLYNKILNYIVFQFIYISSLFNSKPNNELKHHVY